MEFIYQFIPVNLATALNWTLLHSVWQISLIGLVLYTFRRGMDGESHALKYWSALTALFASFIVTLGTFLYYFTSLPTGADIPDEMVVSLNTAGASLHSEGAIQNSLAFLSNNQELIVFMWFLGFAFLLIKFGHGLYQTKYIKSTAKSIVDPKLMKLFTGLKLKMNISKYVSFAESKKINTAIVAGYWQPVILFPVCMLNQLTEEEIKAILAHELAHIKRNDFVVNLFQTIAELILYYHPVIWWMSTIVNEEREICCDDLALSMTGNHHAFAKALVKLQEYKLTQNLPLAMSFSGNKHEFKNRIFRILNQPIHSQLNKERTFAIAAVMMIAVAFGYTDNVDNKFATCEIDECMEVFQHFSEPIIESRVIVISKECGDNNDDNLKVEHIFSNVPNAIRTIQIKKNHNADHEMIVDIIASDSIPNECKPRQQKYGYFLKEFDGDMDSLMSQFNNKFQFRIDSLLTQDFNEEKIAKLFEQYDFDEFANPEKLQDLLEHTMPHWLHFDDEDMALFENEEFKRFLDPEELKRLMEEHGDEFFGPEGLMKKFENENFFHQDFSDRKHPIFRKNDLSSTISSELVEDEYINEGENFKFEITKKHLKINGQKQPQTIWNKYSKILEEHMGMPINPESKIVIESKAEQTKNIF